jgi:hypothetical protein
MPTQQPLFLANPGLSTLGSQILATGGGSPFIFTQPSLPVTSQPTQIILNAATTALPAAPGLTVASALSAQPVAAAQLPVVDGRMSFCDGSFRLDSDDRLTFKGQVPKPY